MKDYKHYGKCQVCKLDFKQDDDIVVCPECGAPYHRACYEIQGNCVYSDRHDTGFTYSSSTADNAEKGNINANTSETNRCPHCFQRNLNDALFCINCGALLPKNEAFFTSYGIRISPALDFLYKMGEADMIGDIKISEFARYTKSNLLYYLPLSKNIHERNQSRFNFCAFLFSGSWFLYRKLYKIGTAITVALMLLMILSSLIEYIYIPQILTPIFKIIGVTSTSDFAMNKSNEFFTQISILPVTQQFLLFLPLLIKTIQLAIMLISGIVANRIYFKNCCSKIRKIKTLCKDDNRLLYEKMDKYGGTNLKIVTLLIVCYMIIEYLPRFLI